MDILWVTPQLPCRRSGGQVRQYHLLKHLCQKHRVKVLSLVQDAEIEDVPALQSLGAEVITESFTPPTPPGPWRNRLRSWTQLLFDSRPQYALTYSLDALRRQLFNLLIDYQPDVIQFEHLFVAPLGDVVGQTPWLLTEHNIESRNATRQVAQAATTTRRLAGRIEARKLYRWEQRWVARSTACLAVSETEAVELQVMAPGTSVYSIPNGVDTIEFAPPNEADAQRSGLLFFGTFGYAPNVDAVIYFCREILPILRSDRPELALTLIGGHAPSDVIALGELPGVRYLGFVDDLRPYLWQAAACVVPLRSGGGTRLKILEALAAGCPVVSTTLGAEGLELVDGRDLLIADKPITFARHVSELLDEPDRARRLARQGQQAVETRYDWRVIAPRLETAYQSTVADYLTNLNGRGVYYA